MKFNFLIIDDIGSNDIPYFDNKKKTNVSIQPKGYSSNGYPTLICTKKILQQQKNNTPKKRR